MARYALSMYIQFDIRKLNAKKSKISYVENCADYSELSSLPSNFYFWTFLLSDIKFNKYAICSDFFFNT